VLVHSGVFGVGGCLLYKLGLQRGFSASGLTFELSESKKIFAINPTLVSGIRKIVSFIVTLNILSPTKL